MIPKGSIITQNCPLLKVLSKWILKYVFKLIHNVHNNFFLILNQHNHVGFNILIIALNLISCKILFTSIHYPQLVTKMITYKIIVNFNNL
jgi:hypothetical protein